MVTKGASVLRAKAGFLRTTANRIETGQVRYRWRETACCNCGTLAQVILGVDAQGIKLRLKGYSYRIQWERLIASKNEDVVLGMLRELPINRLFTSLYDAGFTDKELNHLEDLSDPDVISFFPHDMKRDDPFHVVVYMKKWAELLEARARKRKR